MLTANLPALAVYTRALLCELVASGDLQELSQNLLLRALAKTRPRSHAGWVFALAQNLGAPRTAALQAGSFAELCCAAIDLVDDVQDGDATSYLGEVPVAVQVNVSEHMLVLSVVAAARLEKEVQGYGQGFVAEAYRLWSAMASGQHREVSRETWSLQDYEKVAALTCGKQLELYLRTAAFAAQVPVGPFLPLTLPAGVATQIACDLHSCDPRLLAFPKDDIDRLRGDSIAELRAALEKLPPLARPVLEEMLRFVFC